MTLARISAAAHLYLVILLVVVTFLAPPPYPWLALGILAVQAVYFSRDFHPPQALAVALITLLLTPLAASTVIGGWWAGALILPALPIMETAARRAVPLLPAPRYDPGTRVSQTTARVVLALVAVALLAVALGNRPILAASAVMFAALVARVLYSLARMPRSPIVAEPAMVRCLAGDVTEARLVIRNACPLSIRVSARSAEPWCDISLETAGLPPRQEAGVQVSATPPLAGRFHPVMCFAAYDDAGLVSRCTEEAPLDIRVIPRARYARELGRRFLEQTQGMGDLIAASWSGHTRGIEFRGLRAYQPGDRMRDFAWRHSFKYNFPVVIDRYDPLPGGAILLVNLATSSEEETDWLSYQIVTSALTAARAGVPIVIAAYTLEGVHVATRGLPPRESVRVALRLSDEVVTLTPQRRLLEPPNLLRLRRIARNLAAAYRGQTAPGIHRMIELETETLEEIAAAHPAWAAARHIMQVAAPPATASLITHWNHDADALAVVVARLTSSGYRCLDLRKEMRRHRAHAAAGA